MNETCVFCELGTHPYCEDFRTWRLTENAYALISQPSLQGGHVLIIPAKHFSALPEIPIELVQELFSQAIAMGEQMKNKMGAKAYYLRVNNQIYLLEKSNNLHVGHIHIHVVPRYKEDDDMTKKGQVLLEEDCKELKRLLTS